MKTAVVICPGRGTYTKSELGVLSRQHIDKAALFARFDAIRTVAGQETLAALDGAWRYSVATHTRGDNASALIYAASYADFLSLQGVDVVAVTGNSMGWYTALACGGALTVEDGFRLANSMGALMQKALIGGQLVYPVTGNDWQSDPELRADVMAWMSDIDARADHVLALSIDLGGMLVLAGNDAGLKAFETRAPQIGRFPMRLANHAAFHTEMQAPVAKAGRETLVDLSMGQPRSPLIDGRGKIWWPGATDTAELYDYTLGHQVTKPYDFKRAVTVAAREFAPDLFIVTGPGTTLGSSVAQSLISANWRQMAGKTDFEAHQSKSPVLLSMGREDQRGFVTKKKDHRHETFRNTPIRRL